MSQDAAMWRAMLQAFVVLVLFVGSAVLFRSAADAASVFSVVMW